MLTLRIKLILRDVISCKQDLSVGDMLVFAKLTCLQQNKPSTFLYSSHVDVFSIGFTIMKTNLFRDGVSEGQFYQVLLYELDAIRKVRIIIQSDLCLSLLF